MFSKLKNFSRETSDYDQNLSLEGDHHQQQQQFVVLNPKLDNSSTAVGQDKNRISDKRKIYNQPSEEYQFGISNRLFSTQQNNP